MMNKQLEKLLVEWGIDDAEVMSDEEINNYISHPLFCDLNLTKDEVLVNKLWLDKIIEQNEKCLVERKSVCPFGKYHLIANRNKRWNYLYLSKVPCEKTKYLIDVRNKFIYNYYNQTPIDIKFKEMSIKDFKNVSSTDVNKFPMFHDVYNDSLIISINNINSKKNKTNNFHKGLYLYGAPGVGKTYLLLSIANTLAKTKSNINVALIFMPDFVKRANDTIQNKNTDFKEYLEMIKNVEFLFIDDIGSESGSEWFYSNFFLDVLNFRCAGMKTTFFSSNINIDDYCKYIQKRSKNNDQIFSSRINRRLKELVNEKYIK